jgi:fatty-acyl-CoA synthase
MQQSCVAGPVKQSLLAETISGRLRMVAAQNFAAQAVVVGDQRFRATYGELLAMAENAARSLMAIGVQSRDRVGILAANRYEWLVLQYATAIAGGILVPVSPYGAAPEVRYVLRNAGVKVLVHAAEFRGTDLSALVKVIRPECPGLRQVLDIDREWPDFMRNAIRVTPAQLARREATVSQVIQLRYCTLLARPATQKA